MKLRANVRPQWQWAKIKAIACHCADVFGTISMYGQSKMISGIVQSESDGEPLVGATVIVKRDQSRWYHRPQQTLFRPKAGQGQTLIVSIGYRSKEIKVGKQPYRRAITRGQRNVGRSSSCRLRYDETQ